MILLENSLLVMEAEAYKLHHLGVIYQIRRSTISDANNRRNSDFFKDIYFSNINLYSLRE